MTDYEKTATLMKSLLKSSEYAVLSTASGSGVVSASTMCMVSDGLDVYFQTDKNYEKAKNIAENSNVAITLYTAYFKGRAEIIGRPSDNEKFIDILKKKNFRTYENYSLLPSQVLIKVKLSEGRIWKIADGKEVVTVVNFADQTVRKILCKNSKGGY
jgi:general stress protein 26